MGTSADGQVGSWADRPASRIPRHSPEARMRGGIAGPFESLTYLAYLFLICPPADLPTCLPAYCFTGTFVATVSCVISKITSVPAATRMVLPFLAENLLARAVSPPLP